MNKYINNSSSFGRGFSPIGIVITLVVVGIITGGLYFYLSNQIPEIPSGTGGSIQEEDTSFSEELSQEEVTPEEITTPTEESTSPQAATTPAPQPEESTTPEQTPSVIEISNLPTTIRQAGATNDIRTVNSAGITEKSSDNLFSRIFIPNVLAETQTRLLVYLVPDLATEQSHYKFFSYDLLSGSNEQLINGSFSAPIGFSVSPLGYVVFYSGKTFYKFNIAARSLETIQCTIRGGSLEPCVYEGPFPPSISPDGSKIAFFQGNLRVYSLIEGNEISTHFFSTDMLKNDAIWSNDGNLIYVKTVRSVGGLGANDIYEINLSTGESKMVISSDTAKHQLSLFKSVGVSQTFLYIGETLGGDIDRFLVKHDTTTGAREYRGVTDFLQAYVWTLDRTKLYFTQGGGVRSLDFSTGQVSDVLMSVKSPYLRLVGFGRNNQELIISDGLTSGGSRTAYYYSYNIQTKSLSELFQFAEPAERGW